MSRSSRKQKPTADARASGPVGYIRVSTTKQDESGLSLEEQERRIRAWAEAQGLVLQAVYEDGAESAKDLERPQVKEILRRVAKGEISHVVIYKLDRLTRSVRDLYHLIEIFQKHKVAFCSVTESLDTSSAVGRAMVGLIGIFAQWERETIAERTKVALHAKRLRKEKLGGHRPYGYRVKGVRLIADPEEQKVIRLMLDAYEEGKGPTEIAGILNDGGIRPQMGKKWYASTVIRILRREGQGPVHT